MLPSRQRRFLTALMTLGLWANPRNAGADSILDRLAPDALTRAPGAEGAPFGDLGAPVPPVPFEGPPAILSSGPVSAVNAIMTTPIFSFESNVAGRRLGVDVATAGDVNGDGFSDVVALGVQFNGPTSFYLFFGGPTGLTLAPGFPVTNLPFFASMARGVGDLDNNGLADVAIGFPASVAGGSFRVFFGRNGTLDMANPFVVTNSALDGYGEVVAPAGDVNGDGVDDLVVGSPQADNINPYCGAGFSGVVDVYFGAAGTGPTPTNLWSVHGCMWVGNAIKFGAAVGTAGDVNGDGVDDLAIGAPDASSGGRVFVVHGSTGGLPVSPVHNGLGSLAGADVLVSPASFASFGGAVITAGDVNGDGFADLAVGSPDEDFNGTDSGFIRVFAGSSTGVRSDILLYQGTGDPFTHLGRRVFPAGDVNGDARADLLVGQSDRMFLNQSNGGALVFAGNMLGNSLTYCTAGDVNGDGLSDIVVGDAAFGSPEGSEGRIQVFAGRGAGPSIGSNWSFKAAVASANLGGAVAPAGDVNGDGFEDVLTSAPSLHAPDNNGAVFLNYGSPTGLTPNFSDWSFVGSNGDILGWAVSAAGDVNGDGYGDFMAGAPSWGGNGKVLIWHGRNGGVPMGAAPDLTLFGQTANSWFGGVLTSGDFNGDGYADIAVGAPGTSEPGFPQRGRVFVYVGSPTGLNPTPAFQRAGEADDRLGEALVGDIDLNGDGYTDLVIGAPNSDDAGPAQSGRIEVWIGRAGSPPLQVGTGRHHFAANDRFGDRLANAGDVNGDGFGDLIVGMPQRNGSTGRVEIWLGQASPPNGNLISFAADWVQDGGVPGAAYGSAVSGAGDVNGDGLSDLMVGSPLESGLFFTEIGAARLYLGPLPATPAWSAIGSIDRGRFGAAVANAGDVNADGWSDLIIGSPANSENADNAGRADVFLGAQGIGRLNLMMPQRNDGRRVQLRGLTDNSSVRLINLVTTAAGRTKIRMQWDFQRAVAFPPVPMTGTQSAFTLTGPPASLGSGALLVSNVTGLSTGVPYAWRARTAVAFDLLPNHEVDFAGAKRCA